ncbi:MAG: RluA family pseudouridine synthase [Oscillospiraceae bacterium]|nr:RluA family pseudouridine synthase [Oscillospiraceae bacterium]
MHTFTIGANDAGQRADKFLLKACPKLPKSLLYKTFRRKDIQLNGKRIPPAIFLQAGDVMQVYLPDEFFVSAKKKTKAVRLPMPEIVYEDTQIALLKKPVNLPVHADDKGSADTLAGRFLYYLASSGAYDPETEQSFTPALCNRLDRNTEGFVIGAKTAAALREVNEMIRLHRVRKQYLCVTAGAPPKQHDTVTAYHRRREGHDAEISAAPREGFREIVTEYELLQKHDDLALCLVTLHTGRTHQIRAQMAALGCPVLGDNRYGNAAANRRHGEEYQLLAACFLTFDVPEQLKACQQLRGKSFSYTPDFCRKYEFSI